MGQKKNYRQLLICAIALFMSLGLGIITYIFLKKLVTIFSNNEFYLRIAVSCVWIISWPSFIYMLNSAKEEPPPNFQN